MDPANDNDNNTSTSSNKENNVTIERKTDEMALSSADAIDATKIISNETAVVCVPTTASNDTHNGITSPPPPVLPVPLTQAVAAPEQDIESSVDVTSNEIINNDERKSDPTETQAPSTAPEVEAEVQPDANIDNEKEKSNEGNAAAATTTVAEKPPSKQQNPTLPAQQQRPIKRARTAYFIFAEEKRPEVAKEHQGEGVAVVGKALGALWNAMTAQQKQVYQEKAAEERARVAKDLEAWNLEHPNEPSSSTTNAGSAAAGDSTGTGIAGHKNSSSSDDHLVFPVAKMRRICKLDPEVRGLSKEALVLITKAAELSLAKLGKETVRVAAIQNRRKLLPDDVAMVCSTREQFQFLREDIADLTRIQLEQQKQQQAENKTASQSSSKAAAAAAAATKPLTAYFAVKPKSN